MSAATSGYSCTCGPAWNDLQTLRFGKPIAVIGSPVGLEGTLSEGIVSAARNLMGDTRLLQISAAVSTGSSGSPVLDAKGGVIGVASAQIVGGQALNFAMPVEVVVMHNAIKFLMLMAMLVTMSSL